MYRSSLDKFHVIIAWCEDIYDRSGGSRLSDKGGGGHRDREIRGGGAGFKKKFFRPFGPHFGLKIRGEAGSSPGSTTGSLPLSSAEASFCCVTRFLFFDYCYFLLGYSAEASAEVRGLQLN